MSVVDSPSVLVLPQVITFNFIFTNIDEGRRIYDIAFKIVNHLGMLLKNQERE